MVWTPRDIGRLIGAVLFFFGLLCLPVGVGANSKRDTSLFNNFVDMALWLRFAIILIPLGIVIALLSFLLPGDD